MLLWLAAVAAGVVNALAGGGTLITFPALMAVGIPALTANVVSTVALAPGYFGATVGQRRDLEGQRRRLALVVLPAVLGGVTGARLLLGTGDRLFRELVPFLILFASALLAVQSPVRDWLVRHSEARGRRLPEGWVVLPLFGASVYGGYFGAGLSVIVLAVLGLALEDDLTRLNALKQAVSLGVSIAAALYLVQSRRVEWNGILVGAVVVMATGALVGGALGGRLAGSIEPGKLRWLIVAIGVVISAIYFAR